MIRLPLFILTWIVFLVIRTIFIFLGLIIVPIASIFHLHTTRVEKSKINGRYIINWKFRLLYPWGNDEDGVEAGDELKGYPVFIRIIYWSAIRNPVNNLRFIKGLYCKLDPSRIKFLATKPNDITGIKVYSYGDQRLPNVYIYDDDRFRFISLTWQGVYSNLRIQFKMLNKIWRFWIGWKIYPHDSLGIGETDYRRFGAGFATQFKRIYPRN